MFISLVSVFSYTFEIVVCIRRAPNPVTRVPGKETKHAMTKIITAVVAGTAATVAVPPEITTFFTAQSASV